MKKTLALIIASFLIFIMVSCASARFLEGDTVQLQILATSDTHGRFLPFDFSTGNMVSTGSLTQIATAVKKLKTDNTILVDAGDFIQGNLSNFFLDEELHPTILAMNTIGYDVWTTGNHEYNYGIENLKRIIGQNKARLICGNVRDTNGSLLGEPYIILEKNGVKIALIGMVTSNITSWDKANLQGCTVSSAVEETVKIINRIKNNVDVIIAVEHMDIENELLNENTGVRDLANACPELDLIIAAHGHKPIDNMVINGVPIVENKSDSETLAKIVFNLEYRSGKWIVTGTDTALVKVSDYEADPDLSNLLQPYYNKAIDNLNSVIGYLDCDYLIKPNEIPGIPTAQVEDCALLDFVNEVQCYYSSADVSLNALFTENSNLFRGNILLRDASQIYKYENSLYKVQMNGSQLKKFLEWNAKYYNTFHPGDLTVSFNSSRALYSYNSFSGINFEINVSKEPGKRIENLTWQNGTPVSNDDVFTVAINNYMTTSVLLQPGVVFEEGEELPTILETEVGGNIGNIRDLIIDYISNVKGGIISPTCDYNWKITGTDWNESLRAVLIEQIKNGLVTVPRFPDGKRINTESLTENSIIVL